MIRSIKKKIIEDELVEYLMKNSGYKILNSFFASLFNFSISFCFANYTSSEFYGVYLFILSVISFFSFLSFSGINQSLIQMVANGYDYFFKTSIRKVLKFSLLGSIAIFIFSIFYFTFINYNVIILLCLFIGAMFFPLNSAFLIYINFLGGKEEFKKQFYFRTFLLIIGTILTLFLIFISKNIILHFFLFFTIQFIINLFFTRYCINMIEDEIIKDKEKEGLKNGLFLTRNNIIQLICSNINNVIIGILIGPTILAFYIIGKNLVVLITSFIRPLLSPLFPKISQKKRISKKFFIIIIIFSIFLFLSTILVLPSYLTIFFPIYVSALEIGLIYSFILIIYPINLIFGYYFMGVMDKRVINKVRLIPNALGLLVIIPFILAFEIYGVIFTELIIELSIMIIYIRFRKKINFGS